MSREWPRSVVSKVVDQWISTSRAAFPVGFDDVEVSAIAHTARLAILPELNLDFLDEMWIRNDYGYIK